MASNFDFLKVDLDTAELFSTANMAENNYTQKDYEGVLTKVRKVAENTAVLFADRAFIEYRHILLFMINYKSSNIILITKTS